MVGVAAGSEPLTPEVRCSRDVRVSLVPSPRPGWGGHPGERTEPPLAFAQSVTGVGVRALDAQPHVAHQPHGRGAVRGVEHILGLLLRRGPASRHAAVTETGPTHQLERNLPLEALDRPHQHVVGVMVGRRAGVRLSGLVIGVPVADRQSIVDDRPPGGGHPGRLEHVGARYVAPAGGDVHAVGSKTKGSGAAVEQRAEDTFAIKTRQAEPLNGAVGCDQCACVAVREERILGDRRKRRATIPSSLCGGHSGRRGLPASAAAASAGARRRWRRRGCPSARRLRFAAWRRHQWRAYRGARIPELQRSRRVRVGNGPRGAKWKHQPSHDATTPAGRSARLHFCVCAPTSSLCRSSAPVLMTPSG